MLSLIHFYYISFLEFFSKIIHMLHILKIIKKRRYVIQHFLIF